MELWQLSSYNNSGTDQHTGNFIPRLRYGKFVKPTVGPRTLRLVLADERNIFICFPPFFSYVGFVPASNQLGIFSTDCRCNFSLQFSSNNSTIEKKRNVVRDFLASHSGRNPFHFLSKVFLSDVNFFSPFF